MDSAATVPVSAPAPTTGTTTVPTATVTGPQATVRAAEPAVDLREPRLYLNRELSHLEFNARVLSLARDPSAPLLDRLRFLTISSTNLDQFFEIRVAGLKQQVGYGSLPAGPDGLSPAEQLTRISEVAHRMVAEQYQILDELWPMLEERGIRLLRRAELTDDQRAFVRDYFHSQVLPVLTPVGLDPAHPFPRVLNKSLNFAVWVEGDDAFGRRIGIAVVQVPRSLPRLIALPRELVSGAQAFIMLSSVIHEHVADLFPGMRVSGCYQFRVTRNSDLFVDEEEIDDLLNALRGELPSRNYGDAVRLEVADTCSREISDYLTSEFALGEPDVYRVGGPVNLGRLGVIYDLVDRPDLKYPPFAPALPRRAQRGVDIFEAIRQGDLLLHHPFESFRPVVELVRQAAADAGVLAIKQTLYRVGAQSPIVDALIEAARAGKEVTAVVELRARFDEAANIDLATRLQEGGANVVYGVVGYKTHAKMMLVVRREGDALRRYIHMGTGNYHVGTTRGYTDYSLLTCDPALAEDVHKLFLQLTGLGTVRQLDHILQAPFTLHPRLMELIARETDEARAGRPARIAAKMNALSEPSLIEALYRASQAGVVIDLIVRGICALRPGIPGVSENIRVRSILGRFLEHSRVFHFHAGGEQRVYLASADWMSRNLFNRIETAFPVLDPLLRARVLDEAIATYLADNTQAWQLASDGTYTLGQPVGEEARSAQQVLLARLASSTVTGTST